MKVFLIILALTVAFVNITNASSVVPKFSASKLHFDRFDGMCRDKNVPITINYTITNIDKRLVYFNITTQVKEDVIGKPLMDVHIQRCKIRENLDTCEEFLNQTNIDYCLTLDPVASRLGPWFIDYKPQYKCPIKKGTYFAYNSKLDTLGAMVVPMESWHWKAKLETFDVKTRRLLHCTKIEAHLSRSS